MNKEAAFRDTLKRFTGNVINRLKTNKGKVLAGGAAALGIGGGILGARKIAPLYSGIGHKEKSVEFTDRTKSKIRWNTYPGGPILEGPTQTMKELFRIGQSNRKQGLIMLAKLLKQGVIRKVGRV